MTQIFATPAQTPRGFSAAGVPFVSARRRDLPIVSARRRAWAVLTAGAVALSVVLASGAPVRADDKRDLVKALAAIAVIGVIANEIGKDRAEPVDHRRDDRPYDRHAPRYEQRHYDRHKPRHEPRHEPQRRTRIPAACAIEIEGRDHRDVVVYPERCLRDYGIDRLPRGCAREVRFYGRSDRIYAQDCLRDAGYRFVTTPRGDHERPE